MKSPQIASNPSHLPAHAGVPTVGMDPGLFVPMKTPTEYEAEIADLKKMNGRLQDQLTKALEAFAKERAKNRNREAA